MPKGDKGKYTDKQKRTAEHIEEGYEDRGVSKKEAKESRMGHRQQRIGWREEERLGPG